MNMSQSLTPRVITGVPFAKPGEAAATDLEDNDSPSQCDSKPSSPTSKPSDPLPELEFGNFLYESLVPDNNFVGRIERTATTTQQEKEI